MSDGRCPFAKSDDGDSTEGADGCKPCRKWAALTI